MIKKVCCGVAALIVAIAGGSMGFKMWLSGEGENKDFAVAGNRMVRVKEGMSTADIAQLLHEKKLVKNPKAKAEEAKKHRSIMIEIVDRLSRIPVALLKDDYQKLFFDLAKKSFDTEYKTESIIDKLIQAYDVRSIITLCKYALDDFMMSSFENDIRFQTALLSIYQRISLNV